MLSWRFAAALACACMVGIDAQNFRFLGVTVGVSLDAQNFGFLGVTVGVSLGV
jgi:hypothetical protein